MRALVLLTLAACGTDTAIESVSSDLPPPPAGEGFQLAEGNFTVEPGEEGLYCKRLPIPREYGEAPLFATRIESRLPVGTHHFFMAYNTEPLAAEAPCSEGGPFIRTGEGSGHDGGGGKILFLAGEGEYSYQLPAGYAFHLPTAAGHLVTSHHVLNASDARRDMFGVFNIYAAGEAAVTHPLSSLNCLLQDIWVAPNATQTVSGTCTAPFDLDLVVISSHAHQHLRRFEIRHGANLIYESADWDSPAIQTLDTPLHIRAGEGLTFSCTFENRGSEWIVFGVGDYGEMCAIMGSYAYPPNRPHELPPSLGTIIYRDGFSAPLVETTDIDGPF